MNENITFIFKSLNKKKVAFFLILEILLDFIYYIIPFTFTFFLTLPFTIKKAIIIILVFIISNIIHIIGNYILTKYTSNYLYEYANLQRKEYYKKLIKLPVETISKYQTGYFENIIEKITNLVSKILQAEYFSILLTFIFLFYTLKEQSTFLFITSIITSILCVILSIKILKKSKEQIEKLYEEEYKYSSMYNDYINNIRTVKLLNNENYFINKIKKESRNCYKENKKYVNYYSLEELIRNTLIVIPFILGLIKAVIDLSNGIDTIGIIAFYISIHVEMGFVFEELSKTIINCYELNAIKSKLKIIFKKIDNREKIKEFNKIDLTNVIVKYPKTSLEIKINELKIDANDKISITGKSGQGKTTIVNLLLGNINTYNGTITIDNKSIENYKLDIGVVSQEIELFNMSIKNNLCLEKNLNNKEIEFYLKELELNDLLLFNDGLNTIVGEKGMKLSTGQKRRINILRAYLMNKNIYILDEPTSNLDIHTEEIVVNFILKYFKEKTLIIVTHNNKINEICNKFYKIENHNLKKINHK